MSKCMRWMLCMTLAATAGAQARPAQDAAPQLQVEQVVMLFRHGVRAPLQGEAAAAALADRPWPLWDTPASLLTAHGRTGVQLSGDYTRQWLLREGVLPATGCPAAGAVSVYANTDQRTIASAQILAEALAPGCGLQAGHQPQGSDDPLFRPVEAGAVDFDADAAVASIQRQTGGPGAVVAPYAKELRTMQQILGCSAKTCDFEHMPSSLSASANGRGIAMHGPLDLTSGTAEVLILQYTEGLPLDQVGWGRATRERIGVVSRLHALLFEIYARPQYMAARAGAPLARRVLDTLGVAHAPKLSVLVASDTHIAALSGLLDLHFHLPGFGQDDAPPGGALVLEQLRDVRSGQRYVRLRYQAQSLDQLRALTPLSLRKPPLLQTLRVPGCSDAKTQLCTLPQFQKVLQESLQRRG
ncbi:histidine-type phosphatase [Xanthomonas translucens]|uniref:histidine-type phosphatase n=3 Tax=Xanthomonas campestris pv. translucens TaxID=343 RepID=UPI00064231EA|nr:histidine-type phosphatase [Xanthomonas translucens]AKK68842.1 phosphoanhydride phosphohydrolase [Xanthomonas translucens pv. undulosa]AVY67797.1 phosphoanhydride phosphohydrolase [Xanthomonas translucens pv. undulosa]MCT8271014.1 histidine-type phosphatase [Xanthomonas translucens pv. undulosa]QEN94715.1 histidine-type phosphatase [Xanthomonas translucens pv. undulosa]QEO27558.1 histidine-type phosphatase [Xanthomonas translucens pv. undulosa]